MQGYSHQYEKNEILIKHPVLKANLNSANVGAGYFKIINNSQKVVYFQKIVSEVSEKQEIHEVIEENNVFKMRPISNRLSIKPGTEVVFKPQSYHIMFFKLKKILVADQMIDAKLFFSENLVIPIQFKVILNNTNHHH